MVMALRRGPADLREAVQVNQGSLYPALHRLEQRGWLASEWRASETGREVK
jgi:PadR family transcriptional regulator, regulatory protein PadR